MPINNAGVYILENKKAMVGVEKRHVARGGKISFSEGGNKYRFQTEI
jgi:hypothetical protein